MTSDHIKYLHGPPVVHGPPVENLWLDTVHPTLPPPSGDNIIGNVCVGELCWFIHHAAARLKYGTSQVTAHRHSE